MIELIRKRKLHLNCVKHALIVNAGLQLVGFRPLALAYRPINNQTTGQRLRHYFSITIKPVLVSIKNSYFYSDQMIRQITNNYKQTLSSRSSIKFMERNNSWLAQNNEVVNYKLHCLSRDNTTNLSEFNYSQEINKTDIRLFNSNDEFPFKKQNTFAYIDSHASNNMPAREKRANGSSKDEGGKLCQALNSRRRLPDIQHGILTHRNYINRRFESILIKEKDRSGSEKYIHPDAGLSISSLNGKTLINDIKAGNKTLFESGEELYLLHHKHSFATTKHDAIKTETSKIGQTLPTGMGFYQPNNKTQTSNEPARKTGSSNSDDLNKLIDVDSLVQTVMQKINKTVRIERQRRGLL